MKTLPLSHGERLHGARANGEQPEPPGDWMERV